MIQLNVLSQHGNGMDSIKCSQCSNIIIMFTTVIIVLPWNIS